MCFDLRDERLESFLTVRMCLLGNKLSSLSVFAVRFLAALIRGNRNNCTQFSQNLDWLVSKLERLESSSGRTDPSAIIFTHTQTWMHFVFNLGFFEYELFCIVCVICCQRDRFDLAALPVCNFISLHARHIRLRADLYSLEYLLHHLFETQFSYMLSCFPIDSPAPEI